MSLNLPQILRSWNCHRIVFPAFVWHHLPRFETGQCVVGSGWAYKDCRFRNVQGKYSVRQNHENILRDSRLHCTGSEWHQATNCFPFVHSNFPPLDCIRSFCTSLMGNRWIGGRTACCSMKCWSANRRLMARMKKNFSQLLQITMFHIRRAWARRQRMFAKGWEIDSLRVVQWCS